MACIGGILLHVSTAMVKPAEVKQVLAHNAFHISLMVYHRPSRGHPHRFPDWRLSAPFIIWGVLYRFLDKPVPVQEQLAVQN